MVEKQNKKLIFIFTSGIVTIPKCQLPLSVKFHYSLHRKKKPTIKCCRTHSIIKKIIQIFTHQIKTWHVALKYFSISRLNCSSKQTVRNKEINVFFFVSCQYCLTYHAVTIRDNGLNYLNHFIARVLMKIIIAERIS